MHARMRLTPTGLRLAAATLLLLLSVASAGADIRIRASGGGRLGDYLKLFVLMHASGEKVVIDGPCLSACTLVLSIIPRERVCVTPRAVLGFHAPYLPDANGRPVTQPRAARVMLATYPAPVRSWIERKGGLSRRPLWLRGKELTAIVRRCE
jgi:hypothetical protein